MVDTMLRGCVSVKSQVSSYLNSVSYTSMPGLTVTLLKVCPDSTAILVCPPCPVFVLATPGIRVLCPVSQRLRGF